VSRPARLAGAAAGLSDLEEAAAEHPEPPALPDLEEAATEIAEPPTLPDFEGAPAEEILAWTLEEFFPDVVLASSMQDAVLIDLAWQIEPRIKVFFLETGFHFYETLETARRIREHYHLDLAMLEPIKDARIWSEEGYTACCEDRKVIPMNNFLKGRRAWITGLRRSESETRANAKAVEWDPAREIVKVNPIVEWTDEQVANYIEDNDIIVNPLRGEGYESIGCVPCTIPGSGREGRWAGTIKVECGIHQPLPLKVIHTPRS
jgi:phosphoadenosine phosphosulfate reductase